MKVITFITENNFQVDFEKTKLGCYKVALEYDGNYSEFDWFLEFGEVLEVIEQFNEFDISNADGNKIEIILQTCITNILHKEED